LFFANDSRSEIFFNYYPTFPSLPFESSPVATTAAASAVFSCSAGFTAWLCLVLVALLPKIAEEEEGFFILVK
jgi:hypothetical protein